MTINNRDIKPPIATRIYDAAMEIVERYAKDNGEYYEFNYETLPDREKYKLGALIFEKDSAQHRRPSYSNQRDFVQIIEDNFECIRENDCFEPILDSFAAMLFFNDEIIDQEFLSCIKNNVINYYDPLICRVLNEAFEDFLELKDPYYEKTNDPTYYDWNYAA